MISRQVNPDLDKERQEKSLNVLKLKSFLGELQFQNVEQYEKFLKFRNDLVKKIKPISEENFYNLNRTEKYEMILKKSLEVCEYAQENNITLSEMLKLQVFGCVFGLEKFLFALHVSAFEVSIDLWGTEEQSQYWRHMIKKHVIFGTYVQTEIGHGTYVRGLETTATYDRNTREFILDSPTLTSIKFWPGAVGISCNYAIVIAKLLIDNQDFGIHAFVVQLRSLEDHRIMCGVELGDIGSKHGFESHDNGFVKFTNYRIPLNNMLMKNAKVSADGKFERVGSELIMYACMLILRSLLCVSASLHLSLSTTIAIRYSCVRRQTANLEGNEPQIIEYQTQQFRLFPALATTYAQYFSSNYFIRLLTSLRTSTNNFSQIKPADLAKFHAVSSGLKATSFSNALKFAQSNRLCCGGHGYSAASGLGQIIQEADAGCTYEGDNVVLLLQTARYLLKSAQQNSNPHLELSNLSQLKSTKMYKYFENYFHLFYDLYEKCLDEITNRIVFLINEKGLSKLDAVNQNTLLLTHLSKVYVNIFVMNCYLWAVEAHKCEANQKVLTQLFEFYLLYEICDSFAASFLRLNVLDPIEMNMMNEKMLDLMSNIRENAVVLVDSFDWLDSNLCSALGSYDGNAYERLLEFAKNSQFNQKEVHDSYEKYLKPFVQKMKLKSKL